MSPSANRPDSTSPRRLAAGLSLTLALGLLAAIAVGPGCSRPATGPKQDPTVVVKKVDPWQTAGVRLKKDTDFPACRAALGTLTNELAAAEGSKPVPLTDEALAKLAAVVPLNAADRDEVRGGATFTPHDAAYLADCLYLREAARSLALPGVPASRQAELAFAWVCRQVYLHPWLFPIGPEMYEPVALPPTAVLRRGFGSGLERAYVFLALLQQLGLDGCLVGGPDAGKLHAGHAVATVDKKSLATGSPRGPFWAVGVRYDVKLLGAKVGNVVKLFDPWRSEPMPFTLGQLRANPDVAKGWFEDKAHVSGATLEDAKKATTYLVVPVNSLSPRMAALGAHLKGELGVKTSFDPSVLQAAFPDPKPSYWNPPEDPFAYGRAARSFLPLDLGGADRTPVGPGRLYETYRRDQIPPGVIAPIAGLRTGQIQDLIRGNAANRLVISFIEPPNPRERIQRGQFQDAAKDLVTKQLGFAAGLERLRNNKDTEQQIREWSEEANRLYEVLGRARLPGNPDKSAEARAQADLEAHVRKPGATLLIDQASAEAGQAEATFLLALCKHEQAERAQARLERATGPDTARLKVDATDAWRNALAAWRTYEQMPGGQAGFPGRLAHTKALSARAEKLVKGDEKK